MTAKQELAATEFRIEVVDGNWFNAGWVRYVLGLPRPEVAPDTRQPALALALAQEGWDMADETPSLASVRHVFEAQAQLERPQYLVRAPETP